jgi:hypothetical protein
MFWQVRYRVWGRMEAPRPVLSRAPIRVRARGWSDWLAADSTDAICRDVEIWDYAPALLFLQEMTDSDCADMGVFKDTSQSKR